MKLKVSLVVSTYGRYEEIEALLESFTKQDCAKDIFEVIIVDQNDVINLSPIVDFYVNKLNLIHYKSTVKGLSKAKNKGIELAKGDIITFPDDDCTYYPNTISSAINFFIKNTSVDVVYGRVYDRVANKGIMRNWSTDEIALNFLNFSLNYSAITCFTRIRLKFDENFGVGSKISSGEELDYVIRAIGEDYVVIYSPEIEVWHPELKVSTMSDQKVFEYAYGYGAIMRKNLNFPIFFIFVASLSVQLVKFFLNIFTWKRNKFFQAAKGRIKGFLKLSK